MLRIECYFSVGSFLWSIRCDVIYSFLLLFVVWRFWSLSFDCVSCLLLLRCWALKLIIILISLFLVLDVIIASFMYVMLLLFWCFPSEMLVNCLVFLRVFLLISDSLLLWVVCTVLMVLFLSLFLLLCVHGWL